MPVMLIDTVSACIASNTNEHTGPTIHSTQHTQILSTTIRTLFVHSSLVLSDSGPPNTEISTDSPFTTSVPSNMCFAGLVSNICDFRRDDFASTLSNMRLITHTPHKTPQDIVVYLYTQGEQISCVVRALCDRCNWNPNTP